MILACGERPRLAPAALATARHRERLIHERFLLLVVQRLVSGSR
jgi:hypothetical protein